MSAKGAVQRLTLREFIRAGWPVCEPMTRYMHGWHIDAIGDHLEAVTRGEIRNLVINMPPRHMKSLSVSVFWPMWVWTFQPETRWLFASYAESLAIRDSLKCRRLIQSPWYQRQWGDVFELAGDQNMKSRFENSRTGYRLATGVGGAATGEGGDYVVCDDPHKTNEAESDAMRENVLIWWDETMTTRLNDQKTGRKVIVMQRLHEDDLSGHVLKQGGYELLCLPAEYEAQVYVTAIGWHDPRSQEEELLWPERFGRDEIDALKRALGPYGAAGQLQQRPVPRGGGMFKREWFKFVNSTRHDAQRVRYWDKAGTEAGHGTTAHTCGVLIAYADGQFVVEDVVRGQWSSGEREAIIKQTAELDERIFGHVRVYVEQEPGSGGKESAENTIRGLAGFAIQADRVTGSKEVRAEPFAAQCQGGNVSLLSADWNKEYLDHVCLFPMGVYKDEVDASSGAFNKLTRTQSASEILEEVSQPDRSRFVQKPIETSRWRRNG